MNITANDILLFIKENRSRCRYTDGMYKHWTDLQIVAELNLILNSNGYFVIDSDPITNEILGICIGIINKDSMIVEIKALLIKSGTVGVLKRILEKFYELFPGFNLQGYRKNVLVEYKNTYRLCKLLEIISI